jgi:hypothetical protein
MALLYGRAGRLTTLFGGSRPGQAKRERVTPPSSGIDVDAAGADSQASPAARSDGSSNSSGAGGVDADDDIFHSSEKDAKLAQKLGQLQPFVAVFPQGCMGQLASFGPT